MNWQAIHNWLQSNSDKNLFGVIVGGVIGIVGGFIVPLCSAVSGWLSGKKQTKARLTALAVELDYVRETIIEIRGSLEKGVGSSKRLNTDLLESVRLTGYELSANEDFTKALATVYRDVVHTNGRLDDIGLQTGLMTGSIVNRARTAFESLKGAERSIEALRDKIKVKTTTTFERTKPPEPPKPTPESATST